MKLEEMRKRWDDYLKHYPDAETIGFVPDLIDIVEEAKRHVTRWKNFAPHDVLATKLQKTTFDPAYKPEKRLGLKEALQKLDKE